MERIEQALDSRPFFVACEYSAADFVGFALTHALPRLMPDLCNHPIAPRMMIWLDRMLCGWG